MCLTIDDIKHSNYEPLITTKDIYTLKTAYYVNELTSKSYYRCTKQKYGELLPKQKVNSFNNHNILKGYHSLLTNFTKTLYYDRFDNNIFLGGKRGCYCIILCRIPKGTKYFIGLDDDIVSETIELIQPIVLNDNSVNLLKSNNDNYDIDTLISADHLVPIFFKECVKHCRKAGIKIGF